MLMKRRKTIIDKIMDRIEITDAPHFLKKELGPCHIWQGPTSGSGRGGDYPRMSLDGQTVAVHLVVYTHWNGFIPGKKQIDHLCNIRRCVAPLHLEMVTHKRNQKRRAERAKITCSAVSSDGASIPTGTGSTLRLVSSAG